MSALYLDQQGAVVHRRSGTLVVQADGRELAQIPEAQLDRLVIIGNVQISTPVLAFLLDRGIPTAFVSTHGEYRGRLEPPFSKNVLLRYEQFKRYADAPWRLHVSKAIIHAKIANARTLLMQHARNHPETDIRGEISALERLGGLLHGVASVESLLGVEGSAAAAYFHALGKMVRREFAFEKRTKHPPLDPVNCLLSFGYTLVCNELAGALSAVGLDPYFGFYHDLRYGRPSLAVDLLEEFRYAVDALALSLLNKGLLKAEDFQKQPDGACYLTEPGRAVFFQQYEKKVMSAPSEAGQAPVASYRSIWARQAQRMANAIEKAADYVPHKEE